MNILACLGDPIACTWGALPPWAQWGLVICATFFVAGIVWRFKDVLVWVHKIAGWPGVGTIVGAVAILLAVFWPKGKGSPAEPVPKRGKSSPGFEFPKIGLPRMGGKKRVYDQDTNSWKDAP